MLVSFSPLSTLPRDAALWLRSSRLAARAPRGTTPLCFYCVRSVNRYRCLPLILIRILGFRRTERFLTTLRAHALTLLTACHRLAIYLHYHRLSFLSLARSLPPLRYAVNSFSAASSCLPSLLPHSIYLYRATEYRTSFSSVGRLRAPAPTHAWRGSLISMD